MNASMVIPISVARVVPLSFMGAGAMITHGKQLQGACSSTTRKTAATTSGFDDLFDNGANILGFWRFFTDLGGLPGSHLFGGIWSTGDFVAFDPAGFVIVPGRGHRGRAAERGLHAAIHLRADAVDGLLQPGTQRRLAEPCGAWPTSRRARSVGRQRRRSRPRDSAAAGRTTRWASATSTPAQQRFPESVQPSAGLARRRTASSCTTTRPVAKCFQLTTDLQVIEPANVNNDTAVVFGLRGTIGM